MKDEQKLSFWKKLRISVTNFEKYQDLAAEKVIKTIGYIATIMIIFSIIVAGIYIHKFSATINNVKTYIADNIETINFENNKLTIIPKNKEKVTTIENEEMKLKVIINTQAIGENEIQENIDSISSAENEILILSDKVMLKKVMLKNQSIAQTFSYSYEDLAKQYNINKLDKQETLNLLSTNSIKPKLVYFYGIIFLYMFIMYLSSVLVDIIILSALGYIATMIAKIRIRYSAIYNIAAYSLTLPIILNIIYFVVNAFTGFTIKYFEVMYTCIASIYIITAILMIKSDVIKKEMELAKIVEEQEKVRLELERKEEERKEQEEKERQKREEEKERKQKGNDEVGNKEGKRKKKQEEPNLDVGNQPSVVEQQEES